MSRSFHQVIFSGFRMYMYSTPIESQYVLSKCPIISESFLGPIPTISPALKVLSKSLLERPKFSISNVGEYFLRSLTGLVFVNKCPLVLYPLIKSTTKNSFLTDCGISTDVSESSVREKFSFAKS